MKRKLTNREKSTLLTIISSFIPSVLVMILGAIKTRYIISFMGSDKNGIYQLMLHLSTFVEFGNLGLASAFRISYFNSISSNDTKKTTEIYNYSKIFFKIASIIMIGVSVFISIISIFIIDSEMSRIQILVLQLLICAPNVLDFYTAKDVALLSARQKEYIYIGFNKTVYVIRLIISLILIKYTNSLFIFLSVDMILSTIRYLIIGNVIKKDNSIVLEESKTIDNSPIKISKYLIPNKISRIIFLNIDTILISAMISNTTVSIYTTYFYITNCLVVLEEYIVNSFINSLGNLYHSEDSYKNAVTQEIILLLSFLFVVICVPLTIGMESFVSKIWIGNENYLLDNVTYILICICFVLYSVRLLSGMFEDSIGSYKETYIINGIQAVSNILFSIILCKAIGLKGIILATVITLAPFEIMKIKKSLKLAKVSFNRSYFYAFIILSIVEIFISFRIMSLVSISGIFNWVVWMAISSLISIFVNLTIYCLLFKDFRILLIDLKEKMLK